MENQPRFDLNAAIENWRQELAAQANLTVEVRRELETHLCDAIAGFQKSGLNDEESFWVARRRAGQPQQISEEFVKANPADVWRERILWMAAAVLVVTLWTTSANIIWMSSLEQWAMPEWFWQSSSFRILFPSLLRFLPFFVFVIYLLRGSSKIILRLAFLFQSRSRFVLTATGWLALNNGFIISRWITQHQEPAFARIANTNLGSNLFATMIWPLVLIVLIAWLMTPQDQRIPNRPQLAR